ncbi:methyltransferase [Nocardiopsis alba]|uniref:methyltransferase n=1 Tax=Nocardiopsis alba TaxID=53437 RepID=UPI0036700363
MTERTADDVGAGLVPVLGAVEAATLAQTFAAALEIDLFGALSETSADVGELADELGLHLRALPDFLDALVAVGLLVREDDRYRATAAGRHHLSGGSLDYIGHFLVAPAQGESDLARLLRTGAPADHGGGGDPYTNPHIAGGFIAFMDAMNAMVSTELSRLIDWSAHRSFVDVDGARGGLALDLAAAHPHLRGTVVDRAEVEPYFREHVSGHEAAERLTFRTSGGPLPEADVVLIGGVLHDMPDKAKVDLLRRAATAVGDQGLVLVYDNMIDDDRSHASALLASLRMMLAVPEGGEYTVAECREWLGQAGLTVVHTGNLLTDTLLHARRG